MDILLATQEADTATDQAAKKHMIDRSDRILDMLEKMRMGLLTGGLSVGDLVSLADVVAGHRAKITDPDLLMIIDEIDLRAQIELAKMARAYDAM